MMEVMQQIGERIVTFSDKPLKVDGIKYHPGHMWSDDYRKSFRASLKYKASASKLEDQAMAYISWKRDRDQKES